MVWDCMTSRPLVAFGNCLIQKVLNSKKSVPLRGRGMQRGLVGTMQMAEPEAGLLPRAEAGVN